MKSDWSRREVLQVSAAAVAAMWHGPALGLGQGGKQRPGKPLIRRMRLRTSADLDHMQEFYGSKLGLGVSPIAQGAFTVQAGTTEVTFVKAPAAKVGPLYHFAFNIPQNQIRTALDWAKRRVELIPAWGNLADDDYPKEVIHFRHWNAHSLFFFDPALNLVELIARHDLSNDAKGAFTSSQILHASEIGLPVSDSPGLAKKLNKDLGLPGYPDRSTPQFAMGDQNGLLLCLLDKQTWGAHTKTPIQWGVHATELTISGRESKTYKIEGYPYTIQVEP